MGKLLVLPSRTSRTAIYATGLITSPPCLKFYNPNLPTRLRPDASQDGLGALLEQNHKTTDGDQWFPIAYALRALLPYEKNYAQIEKETLSQLQIETASDPVLQQLKQFTLTGWPQQTQQIPLAVKPYFAIRGEITYNEGLLLKGQRIIIPTSVRPTMKEIIHQGHNGIARCKIRAR